MISYDDLLISSKFFYTEGCEDSSLLFPDETKEVGRKDVSMRPSESCEKNIAPKHENSESPPMQSELACIPSAMDIDIALEAACGDSEFLVRRCRLEI